MGACATKLYSDSITVPYPASAPTYVYISTYTHDPAYVPTLVYVPDTIPQPTYINAPNIVQQSTYVNAPPHNNPNYHYGNNY